MLDPAQRLDLGGLSVAVVYRDHEARDVYHVVPAVPSLATDDGQPELRLLVYLERSGERRIPRGGTITLTTTLDLSAHTRRRVQEAVERLHGAGSGQGGAITLRNPEWTSGRVEIVLTESIRLGGQPSLGGENRCAVSAMLDAAQVVALQDAWARRLPAARIVYEMAVRAASTGRATARATDRAHETTTAGPVVIGRDLTVRARVTAALDHPITLEAPVWTPGLEHRVKELET
jgi:hypothetical protein